ncbi:MAG: 3-dehydroquinate synthase [Bacteroidales bacterium]|nr:3-dehydroquinate synthase [Bacteroidales bacterium]
MKILEIQSSIGESKIYVGETLANVANYLPKNKKIAIITDPVIHSLYGKQFPKADLILEIPQGEENKSMQSLDAIFEKLIENEFDRTSFILGIGGGIVCDMSGFIATIFMRGIEFGFVSTTLLSQVDASVGGKNGVNFRGIKNIIGTFSLPKFVICELSILKSLPKTELLSGMGEVVKYGAIYSEEFFKYIENHISDIKNYSLEVFESLVYESVRIKAEVVNNDARESGMRRIFNFGHTFGHAIEKLTHMPHGCAVSVGMVYAAKLSVLKGKMSQSDCDRLIALLNKMEMPVSCEVDPAELLHVMRSDKKREGESVHFVYLDAIGSCVVEKLSYNELATVINDLR